MPAGRPKSTLDLPDGWQEEILALYREGASDVEIRALINEWRGTFSDDLWYRWIDEEPEFSRTIKTGKAASEAWWAKLGREGAGGKRDINPTTWIFNMKNRFGWADRTKTEHSGGVSVTAIERTIVESSNKDS